MPIVSVFVSSTWIDLQPERVAVERALNFLRETKLNGMEYFGSQAEDTRDVSLAEVEKSDLYIGVIGGRYGSGITEAEYDRAMQLSLKCFVFFKDPAGLDKTAVDEQPEKHNELARFKAKLQANHIVGEPFRTPEQLALAVMASLHRWLVDEHLPRCAARHSGEGSPGAERIAADTARGMVDALLAGVQRVRPDYSVRIQNFCAEYLGSDGKAVPFCGRDAELRYLDDWLAGESRPPYLLLSAPAGRGKSSLLLRWARALTGQANLEVVFIPVSARFRTNLASVVFGSLAGRLAEVHTERLTYSDAEDWRALSTAYMARAVPSGKTLVVVLDGVDEAVDWQVGEDIFPPYPPAGLRVVISARTGPDEKHAGWLTKLGWTDPEIAEQMTLDRLQREAFSALLRSDTFEPRLSARQPDIAEQLFEKTGGDPLLLSLYLQEVRAQHGRRDAGPIQFGEVPRGLPGVLSLWERDLRDRLKAAAAETLTAAKHLCSVLAAAFGPLRRVDLHQLCGSEVSSWALDEAVDSLARFLVGDGQREGYAFTHPRLGQHFYERLAEGERLELDRRFVAWGRRAIAEIETEAASPHDAAPYLVQYLSAHMRRARVSVDELRDLLSKPWKDACFAVEATYSKFVNDTEVLRRALLERDRQLINQGARPRYLADQFLCMLCESSTRSQSDNLTSFVLAAALATGIISPQQCMQLVERRTRFAGPLAADLLVSIVELDPALRDTLQPLILQLVESDRHQNPDTADTMVVRFPRLLMLLDAPTRTRIVAPVIGWIEDRWRAWHRLAEADSAAARSLVNEFDALPSTWDFGNIRPFLEPAHARALSALYVEALACAGLSLRDRRPGDVIGLLPALPSEIQTEVLDSWFDDEKKPHVLEAVRALSEMDVELPLPLKQRYGARLARRLDDVAVEQLVESHNIDLLLLAWKWCGPEVGGPLQQQLVPFVRRLIAEPAPMGVTTGLVMRLPPSLREDAALTLIDELAGVNFDDNFLKLVVAHRHLVGAPHRTRFADAAHREDVATRSKWLAVEALLGNEPDAGLARQAWQCTLEIGDARAEARSYAAFAWDAPAALRGKCLQRLTAALPWLTDAEARLPEGMNVRSEEVIEIMLAAEALAESGEWHRIHGQVDPRLDGVRRARYRLLRAAKFAPNEAVRRAEEALGDIDALTNTGARGNALFWIGSLVPPECLERWAELASNISDEPGLVAGFLQRFSETSRSHWRDRVIGQTRSRTDDLALAAFATACEFLPAVEGSMATEALFAQMLALLVSPRTSPERWRPSVIINALAWSLTPERQTRLLDALENCAEADELASCLNTMAGRLDPANLQRAFAIARARAGAFCPQLLFALAKQLEGDERMKVRREALALAAESRERDPVSLAGLTAGDISPVTHAIVAMARARSNILDRSHWLPVLEYSTLFSMQQRFELWEILVSSLPRDSRRFTLVHIAEIAQLVDALGGAEARHACAEAIVTATGWWP